MGSRPLGGDEATLDQRWSENDVQTAWKNEKGPRLPRRFIQFSLDQLSICKSVELKEESRGDIFRFCSLIAASCKDFFSLQEELVRSLGFCLRLEKVAGGAHIQAAHFEIQTACDKLTAKRLLIAQELWYNAAPLDLQLSFELCCSVLTTCDGQCA